MPRSLSKRVATLVAVALGVAPRAAVAAATERTGWETVPADEMAFVCRAELSERRQVLDGRSSVFRVPLASEAIRVPPLLRKRPEITRDSTDAEREAAQRWNEAWAAYVAPRKARFTEFLLKSRPQEAGKATVDCEIATQEVASRWTHGYYGSKPPTAIGVEFRDIYNPADRTGAVWGKVYHEDFLPPDWTKGLPGVEAADKVVTGPKPAPRPKSPAQTASLTVKTDTSAKDAAKAWDEQVKKTLAAEAQKKVETAAKQTQADTKRQAEITAFFAERRRQGRAQ